MNLIDELGAEDKDNYVYFDSEGRTQIKIELNIIWAKLPNKVLLLALNSESPVKFLKTRIAETMEKYSIFSGLKGFEICNLLYNNQNIPNNGKIGEVLQIGSEIVFDIVSQDLWLDMRVECMEISLVITFEIKVDKKMSCGHLKSTLLDMINQILRAKNVLFVYEENDIKLIKGGQTEEIVIVKDSRSSSFDRKCMPKKLFELEDFMFIQSQFDYLDRFMICTLGKNSIDKAKESFERRLTINIATNTLVTNVLNTVKEVMPCRGIKIESFSFNKNIELKVHTESAKDPIEKSCCKCRVF